MRGGSEGQKFSRHLGTNEMDSHETERRSPGEWVWLDKRGGQSTDPEHIGLQGTLRGSGSGIVIQEENQKSLMQAKT